MKRSFNVLSVSLATYKVSTEYLHFSDFALTVGVMKRNPTPTTLSVADTAERLADRLGGEATHWIQWLKNDRRPGRTQRLKTEPGPGRPRYAIGAVEAYIAETTGARPGLKEQVEAAWSEETAVATLLRGAGLFDDDQLREELRDAVVEGEPIDLVAFEVLAGLDRNNTPTIWVRSGLREGMHLAITLPFTAAEVGSKAGAFS